MDFDHLGSVTAFPWGYLASLCRTAAWAPTDIIDHLRRGPATTSVSHLSPLLSVLRDVWSSGSDGSGIYCRSPIRLFCGPGIWERQTLSHLVVSTDISKPFILFQSLLLSASLPIMYPFVDWARYICMLLEDRYTWKIRTSWLTNLAESVNSSFFKRQYPGIYPLEWLVL